MKKLYLRLFVIALAAMVFTMDGFGQKSILFVGRGPDYGDYPSDVDLFDSLTAWGYVPEWWGSNAHYAEEMSPDFNPLDYANYEGIFINETVDSKVMGHFAENDYPLPCINLEGYAVATNSGDNVRWNWINDIDTELFQAESSGGTADDLVLVVKDNTHYITEIFNIGDELPWSTATEAADVTETRTVSIKEVNVTFSGKLGQMKAHTGDATFWNLVTVDDIESSGNRMVFWGINDNGLSGSGLDQHFGTSEFFTIIKRAAEWAYDDAGGGGVSVEKFQADPLDLVAFPNPASEYVTVRFRASAPGQSVATLYNVAGQQVDLFNKSVVEGKNHMVLDAGKYPAGIYHLHLDIDGETAVTKVVIQ